MQVTALRQLVRPMDLADIAQVMEVEQQSFPTMWPPTAFRREIQHNRLARYLVASQRRPDAPPLEPRPRAPGLRRLVDGLRPRIDHDDTPPEERDELVVGFIGVWLLVDEAHVVTIAVRDSHRGRGVGELLLIAAIETALREAQETVTLECRVSNTVAIRLYEKYGFQQVGLRPRYYSDNHEDAYILTASDVSSPAYRELFAGLRDEHRDRFGDYDLHL
jgi:ribosomal-protein-alanine N-acetyltransferase